MKNLWEELKNLIKKIAQFLSKNYLLTEVLLIALVSLVPLLWFRPGEYVLGHDANYPVDAVNWLTSKITTWSQRYNFGSDQSLILGRIFIFATEALPQFLGASIYTAQKIIFLASFFLPGISMYILSRYLLGSSRKYTFFRIFSSIFYILNHYMLQAWFIAEITKFSILTSLPLVVMFTLKAFDKRIPKLSAILISNLILFIFNGGGAAFTLYGGLFLILIGISIAYLLTGKIQIFKLVGYWFLFSILFLILNSYWIAPLIFYATSNFNNAISTFGGIENTVRWTDALSKYTSIGNLIKLQGIPDWYDSPTHPYANTFLTNPFFIAVSYAVPVVAAFGLLIFLRKKEMRVHLLWIFITIVLGIIFSAGTHPPFTDFYTFLLKSVPFFSTFRSAFYKFGYSLWFTYSLLIGLAINYIGRFKLINLSFNSQLLKKAGEVKLGWKFLVFIVFLGVIFVYNYPFFNASFFRWRENYSTKLVLPQYVFDYQNWAKDQPENTRILILPALPEKNQIDSYKWGYYSLDPLPTLLSNKQIISNNFEIGEDESKKEIIQTVYESLKKSPETFNALTKRLGINSLLLRKDIIFDIKESETDSPNEIENLLAQTSFKPTQTFGEWVIYQNGSYLEPVAGYPQIAEIQYGETTNLEIIKTILSEIGDLPYSRFSRRPLIENSQKLLFLDNSNVTEISEDQNTITYELPYQPGSPELVINPLNAGETNYNVRFFRSGNALKVDLSTPQITITYGNEIKKIESKTISRSLNVGSSGEIGVIINDQIFNLSDTGSIKIPAGADKITITVFEKASGAGILSDLKFEADNVQDKAGSCGGESSSTNANITQSSTSEGRYIELSAEKAVSCLRLPIETGSGVYKLSFDYLWNSGENPSFCVLQQSESSSTCLPETTIENFTKGKWQKYETVFTSASEVNKLILHFYAKSDQEKTTIGYDNIRLEKVNKLSEGEISILDLSALQSEKTALNLENLNTGVLKISSNVEGKKVENISDGSFETSLWGGAFVCGEDNGRKPNVLASFSDDRTDGERSIELSSQSGTACVRNRVANFNKKNLYKLTFDYKNITGDAPSFCLLQLDSDKQCFPTQELKKNSRWQNYSTYFIPETDATALVLHLYSSAKSSNLFDNVKIESVERPYSLAYLKDFSAAQNGTVEASVIDSSSTDYKIRVNSLESSYVLGLDQSFSSNWKMYMTDGNAGVTSYLNFLLGREIPESLHVKINGITNGWVVTDAKPGQEISIEYLPQKIFSASVILSGVAFLILLTITSARFVKTNYKQVKMKLWKEEGKLKELGKKIESIVVEP